MDNENDVSTDDKTAVTEEVEVRVEDSGQEPGKPETTAVGGDTPPNESSEPVSRDDKRSAGQVIADLGNEKKAIAERFIALAQSGPEARRQVKQDLESDPVLAHYVKSKFGSSYDSIMADKSFEREADVDIDKIRAEEQARAEAKVIKDQMAQGQEKMIAAKAQQLGFTTAEFELFKTKVQLLGGDEGAIEDAALIVNSDKARAKEGSYAPDGGEAAAPRKKEVTITSGLNEFAKDRRLDVKQFASELDRVKSLHQVDASGKSVMELPGL